MANIASADNNLLVMTFYIIGISYTFNRMIDSIDEKINFTSQKDIISEQLKEQNIQDDVGISFKLGATYSLGDLKELLMFVENKSENLAVYVDWDNSSIVVEHSKQSYRVIRKSPDITRDLAVPQSPSLVAPKKTLTTTITAENTFELDKESGTYKANKVIVDIASLEKNPVKANRILFKKFMNEETTLQFSLQLVLRISEVRAGLQPGSNKPPMCIVNCPFVIRKLPWTYALPWNKKR
ncbi:hypothetical protein [Calothrix sp. PCC 6303]|uniref:hypothetical protein n=1 Tax=Calothrix sp. PCC 6303 TaxID=1170562 RepID=UPI0002A04419|nr:hypothetical protein [Calothrix sp. PCC 6303]AFZ00719.1 hypothetical protein Cal6303_1678 [Calothrix sp. PCC 6303]